MPFNSYVWLGTILSFLVAPSILCLVAKAETALGRNAMFWSTFGNSYWYSFGTLLGESITRDIECEKTWAVRYFKTDFS